MSNITNDKYVMDVCKMGQGTNCCRYLGMGKGWECLKESGLKSTIDVQTKSMTAKSDNCKGFDIENYDITKEE
ncbi:MAG TPA: hypothetical protein VN026_17190 [Bacteroidia bacterium]|jgi:hypothetical protein|nr:hypothetical protein [Bacteroidia bacterium]